MPSMKGAWKKTKSACASAAQSTQRAARTAVLKAEISKLHGKISDIKKEFGPAAYDQLLEGNRDAVDQLFEETRERIAKVQEEIDKKAAELEALGEKGKDDAPEDTAPSAPEMPTAPEMPAAQPMPPAQPMPAAPAPQ